MDDIKYIKRLHDEEEYLTEWKNIKEARRAIAAYIRKYNSGLLLALPFYIQIK